MARLDVPKNWPYYCPECPHCKKRKHLYKNPLVKLKYCYHKKPKRKYYGRKNNKQALLKENQRLQALLLTLQQQLAAQQPAVVASPSTSTPATPSTTATPATPVALATPAALVIPVPAVVAQPVHLDLDEGSSDLDPPLDNADHQSSVEAHRKSALSDEADYDFGEVAQNLASAFDAVSTSSEASPVEEEEERGPHWSPIHTSSPTVSMGENYVFSEERESPPGLCREDCHCCEKGCDCAKINAPKCVCLNCLHRTSFSNASSSSSSSSEDGWVTDESTDHHDNTRLFRPSGNPGPSTATRHLARPGTSILSRDQIKKKAAAIQTKCDIPKVAAETLTYIRNSVALSVKIKQQAKESETKTKSETRLKRSREGNNDSSPNDVTTEQRNKRPKVLTEQSLARRSSLRKRKKSEEDESNIKTNKRSFLEESIQLWGHSGWENTPISGVTVAPALRKLGLLRPPPIMT